MGVTFEVNRQMCDIGRLISVEEMTERYNKQISQSRLDGLSAWLKLQDMEEKKTKKMTKAEAFEWLKCKKMRVSCRGINESVQSKLFTCGVQWMGGGTGFCDYGNYYVINSHGLLGHCEGPYWERLINEEISADDILSIEVVEEDNEDKPKMFSDYVAIIQSQIVDDEVVVITKKNFMTMVK